MNRGACLRWLLLFSLVAIIAGIFFIAALPVDSKHNIDFSQSIHLREHYGVAVNFAPNAVAASAQKRDHLLGLSTLFIVTYLLFRRNRFAKAFAVTFAVALAVELFQGLIATRSAQLQDVAAVFVAVPMVYPVSQLFGSARDV